LYLSALTAATQHNYPVSRLLPSLTGNQGGFFLDSPMVFIHKPAHDTRGDRQNEVLGWLKFKDQAATCLVSSESTRRRIAGSMPENGAALWIVWKRKEIRHVESS